MQFWVMPPEPFGVYMHVVVGGDGVQFVDDPLEPPLEPPEDVTLALATSVAGGADAGSEACADAGSGAEGALG